MTALEQVRTEIATISGLGLALAVAACSLLSRTGLFPHFGFLFGSEWIAGLTAGLIVAVGMYGGCAALIFEWYERNQPLRRARDDAKWTAYLAIPREPQTAEAQRLGLGLGLQRRR